MVQKKAVMVVTNRQRNTSSVGDMLQHLNWCSLEVKPMDVRFALKYKIANENIVITTKHRIKQPVIQSRHMHYSSFIISYFKQQKQ